MTEAGFVHESDDVRITVRPAYSPQHSVPAQDRWVFAYRIRIDNIGDRTVQLLSRHWDIYDAVAGDSVVDGEGVIGEQPVVAPDDFHEYESFIVLQGPEGHMEGSYHFRRTDGTEFDAAIPRFELLAPDATR